MKKILLLGFSLLTVVVLETMAQRVVSGKVTDDSGEGLPGVNVIIKGTTTGANTDLEGNYQLSVDDGATLIFSFVGFESQEVEIESRTTIDISMSGVTELEEVVVSGVAGNTSTKKVSFAVGQVGEDLIQQAPGANPANALRGKVAGVTVIQGSGLPGQASSIRIRGASSLTGSQSPLIIVDGVILEGTLADINSEDIKSMEVLKGSAASSLYGSRAANGVVQIFTRRGASKEGFSVKIRSEYGISYIPDSRKPSVAQHHAYKLNADNSFQTGLDGTYIIEEDGYADNNFPKYFNSIDEFYKPNTFHSEYVSVSNTSGNTNSLFSFQNLDQDGVLSISQFGYNRKNFRLNHDIDLSEKLRISTSNLYSHSNGLEPQLGAGSAFYTLLFTPPHADLNGVNEEDGSPYNWDAQKLSGWPTTETNSLYDLNNISRKRVRNRVLSNFEIEYDITDYLVFENYYSVDYEVDQFNTFVDKKWLNTENSTFVNGFISKANYKSRGDNFSSTLRFDKTFNKLNIKARANYFHENRKITYESASGSEIGISGFDDLDNIPSDLESLASYSQKIVAHSYSMIVAFDLSDRYLVDFLFRRDNVSLFGPNVRGENFYRVSGAYRITEDINIRGIDEWKIRASTGTSGLRPPYAAQYESFAVSNGVATKSTLGNKDLGSFTSQELEVGTNISFLERFDFEFNYAIKKTKGQVLPVPLPIATGGWPNQWRNAGTLESITFEAALGVDIIDNNDMFLDFNILFAKNKQRIAELFRPEFQTGPSNAFLIGSERDFGIFFGNQVLTSLDGLPSDADPSLYNINDEGYVVLNSDGVPQFVLDESGGKAQVQIGNINHDFNISFNTTFQWKGLNVYALIDWKQGGDVYNQTRQWTYRELLHPDVDQSGVATELKKPTVYYSGLYNVNATTSHFVEDGSFVKLRELNVSYSLPRRLFDNTFIEGVTVGVIGRNLITISKYSGVDPEVTVLGSGDQTNFMFDGFGYPNFTTVTGSLQLTF